MYEKLEKEPFLETKKIMEILPHRFPFLLVDRIVEVDLEKPSILGQKNITVNEPCFTGHFPNVPIMPGVLVIEALAQTGGILVHLKGFTTKIALLMSISNAKFRSPIHPGDVLMLYAEGIVFGSRAGRVKAIASVGSRVAVEAEIGYALVDKNQI